MGKAIVRAVDSGNIQRSPTFQAIFDHALSTPDCCPLDVVFDGAGIDVDNIMRNETPSLKKLSILDAGLHYSLIKGAERDSVQAFVDAWLRGKEEDIPEEERRAITVLYVANKTKVHEIQMMYRNEALLEVGIPKVYLPGMRVPFRHHSDLKLVLPVESGVATKVENYYHALNDGTKKPRIAIYGDFAGIHPLPDELKGGLDTARRQVRYFMDSREHVMRKIIEALSM